ncbi:MAG TPA: pyrimidine 5'-nucleotidase [Rhizomicrobium sp.]|jgi:putative hydrolase of the HAD superfamily
MQPATAIHSAPDFRHVDVWIFDLDNTLYPADSNLFAQVESRMTLFVQNFLGLDRDEARRVQKAYYRDHGTTLNGLMRVHGVDPETYLAFVHDIDISAVDAHSALASAIGRLPGRRFVFTNGCRNHAGRILDRLALRHLFEDMWDIRTIDFRPKPDPGSYRAVMTLADARAGKTAMFDDIARNLMPAHELGCTTVLVGTGSEWSKQGPELPQVTPAFIDYETPDLCAFLETIRM